MRPQAALATPKISYVIAVVERHDDLKRVFGECSLEARRLGRRAEFIFVVDLREKEVIPDLRALQGEASEEITLILFQGAFGESPSLAIGLERARGEIIVTMPAYFQVDPSGLEQALRSLDEGADLVIGCRFPRRDSALNRIQSRLFHWIVNTLMGTDFHDVSSGFRVMKREVAEEVTSSIYGGLHRFLPVIALNLGFQIKELQLPQRDEDRGLRYYGVAIYLKRLIDVLTVFFLVKFTRRPLRFFGLLGMFLFVVGTAISGYLGIYRFLQLGPIGDRPLLLLGVLLVVLGIQTLSLGLIGEIIIFTHARTLRDYRIVEIVCPEQEQTIVEDLPEPHGGSDRAQRAG